MRSRLINAWNNHKDDLGIGGSAHWPSILHYLRNLDRITQESMGQPYDDAARAMPEVRLAGADVPVHPRALYFTASAQVGMDRREGRAEGDGHYIPAGGFRMLLRDIAGFARRLAVRARGQQGYEQRRADRETAERENEERRARGERPRRRDPRLRRPVGHRPDAIRGGAEIYNTLARELRMALAVMREQEDGDPIGTERDQTPAHHADEHREPEIRAFILNIEGRINGLPTLDPSAEGADQSAATNAVQIEDMLQGIRGEDFNHGYGSVDPHGTDHAIGNAIDIYNGRNPAQNFGIPREYLPFVYELISRNGGQGAYEALPRTARPTAIGELPPDQAHVLARLVHDEGPRLAESIREQAPPEGESEAAPPPMTRRERREAVGRFNGLRGQIRRALQNRRGALQPARVPAGRRRIPDPLEERIEREYARLARDIDSVPNLGPADLGPILDYHIAELDAIETQLREQGVTHEEEETPPPGRGRHRQRRRTDPLTQLGPDDGRNQLTSLRTRLRGVSTTAATAIQEEQMERLREIVSNRAFERWLSEASTGEQAIYTQPRAMVESMNEVNDEGGDPHSQESEFYGGHHWQVAPRAIYDGPNRDTAYHDELVRDMRRHVAQGTLERVLSVMSESPGGRGALFGIGDTPQDPTFRRSLNDATGGPPAAQTMLDRVRERTVTRYEDEGDDPEAASLRRDLRDHGHYLE